MCVTFLPSSWTKPTRLQPGSLLESQDSTEPAASLLTAIVIPIPILKVRCISLSLTEPLFANHRNSGNIGKGESICQPRLSCNLNKLDNQPPVI